MTLYAIALVYKNASGTILVKPGYWSADSVEAAEGAAVAALRVAHPARDGYTDHQATGHEIDADAIRYAALSVPRIR